MDFDEFAQLVCDALDNLYDQASLQTHPLVRELGVAPLAGETVAEALRRRLHDAVESLRPPSPPGQGPPPPSSSEWLPYRVLSLHYLGSWSIPQVCEELSFSVSSFYRQRHKALDAVASVLWRQRRPSTDASAADAADETTSPHDRTLNDLVALPRQAVSLPALLEGVARTLRPLAERHGVSLHWSCDERTPTASIAPEALRQIALGLLADCIVGLDQGRLIVQLATREDHLLLQVETPSEMSILASRDAADDASPFWRDLVEAFGGRLWVKACPGGGTILGVSLPLPAPLAAILVVDDDESALDLYRRYLEPAGYLVHAARNAQEAREALAQVDPDLILLDIILPHRDGWTLLGELSSDGHADTVPVIVCSVAAQTPLARSLGAADVLPKPITREELLATVERWLDASHTLG
ncbi:MAG: ATP-binding response regulator [Anaerolineae bacterium]